MDYDSRTDAALAGTDLAADSVLTDAEEDRQSRRRTILIIVGAIVALIIVFFALHGFGAKEEEKKDQAPRVTVVAPGAATVEGSINVNGSLGARREMPVGVVGEGGQVRSVLVEAGDWVSAGQVLAVIDRSVQAQQQVGQGAQIQVSEADARLAQANLERALKLVDRGFISKADVDRLTATRDAANARVRVARASYGQIGAQIARLNIVAPAAGLILERKIEPGQVVGGGSGVLFRIAKGGEMELRAQVGEVDLAKITAGVTAEVMPVGGAKKFTGQVWQVSPVIDPASRQGFARIALAYAPELRPGGFAAAVIKAGSMVAPLLPDSAVLSDNQGSFVYIVRRNVKIGLVTDKGIAIAAGLAGSERVVLRAGGFLSPGETIQPIAGKL
jgi:HlyD family secretion protein